MTNYEQNTQNIQANEALITAEQQKLGVLNQKVIATRESMLLKLKKGEQLNAERTRLFALPEGQEIAVTADPATPKSTESGGDIPA